MGQRYDLISNSEIKEMLNHNKELIFSYYNFNNKKQTTYLE